MDSPPPPMPSVPAHVREAQVQSVSQLQQIDLPPGLIKRAAPRKASSDGRAMPPLYALMAVMAIAIATCTYFLVRALAE